MADLNARPRGGWQLGNFRHKRGRNFGPYSDANPDPAPEASSVTRQADGSFLVRHFPHIDAQQPCCVVKVTPRDGESDIETLARADRILERVHPQRAVA